MVGYDDNNNALTLGDDDSIAVGDYRIKYNSTDDEWHAEYGRPIGGESGAHGDIPDSARYSKDSEIGSHSIESIGDAVSVPHENKFDLSAITVSVWFKLESPIDVDGFTEFAAKAGGGNDDLFSIGDLSSDAKTIGFRIGDGSATHEAEVVTDPSVGVWHLATGTYDGSAVKIYLDGTEQASTAISTTLTQNNEDLLIAKSAAKVDDVRIYNRALTASEVTDLYNGVDVSSGLISRHDFEFPETPNIAIDSTGEAFPKNSVPRSTSGSLVPQGLAESVAAGEALADDGNTYSSVQDAVNAASGWVFVGPGTFNESVTISTAGLTLEGVGEDTVIDTGSQGTDTVLITANDCTVRSLTARNDGGRGTANNVIDALGQSGISIDGISVPDGDRYSVFLGDDCTLTNSYISGDGDDDAVKTGARCVVSSCTIENTNFQGVGLGSDSIITNNVIDNTSDSGVLIEGNDSIVIGNRISNSGNRAVEVLGTDNIVANNRLSDSTNADLKDNGTGTLLDGNLTGPSN